MIVLNYSILCNAQMTMEVPGRGRNNRFQKRFKNSMRYLIHAAIGSSNLKRMEEATLKRNMQLFYAFSLFHQKLLEKKPPYDF